MFKNKNTSQYIRKQGVYSVGKVHKVHSNFLSKCTAACIFVIAGVQYILLLLGTPAIRNPGAGVLVPFYDHDTRTVYLAGKGDGNIRYYELTDQGEPYLYFLSEYKSSSPQRCLGVMPKIGLDVTRNEIMRFYKLFATGSVCEPISMIVPRKAETFQYDIYPDTPGPYPALSPDEWISGIDRDPILVSMKDRIEGSDKPKITTYRTFDSTPVLLNRGNLQRIISLPIAEVAPTMKSNLTDQSQLAIDIEQQTNHEIFKKIESLRMPATSTEFNHIRDKFQNSTRQNQPLNKHNFEIKKKVWSVNPNEHYSSIQQSINEIDYHQEYLKQQEEIQSLHECLLSKDNQIRLLEDELNLLKIQIENQDKQLTR